MTPKNKFVCSFCLNTGTRWLGTRWIRCLACNANFFNSFSGEIIAKGLDPELRLEVKRRSSSVRPLDDRLREMAPELTVNR